MDNSKTVIKFGLTTLGCKVNQCDSAALAQNLQTCGFVLTPFNTCADAYIINTCTVTAFADFQARQLIRRARRLNPRARIIVTGCYAQTQARQLAELDGVTFVVGNASKQRIAELLCCPVADQPRIMVPDINLEEQFTPAPAANLQGRTRAFFKIQDGCNAFCSYCIVPFARGKSRSLAIPSVLEGARNFTQKGYQEIVLTGIHLGYYGQDLRPPIALTRMLETLLSQNPQTRFRLSSIEPHEITDDLLDLFCRRENLCPHLHIPLQSGADSILNMMKRGYDAAFYRQLVLRVAKKVPAIAIGADVLVGFPGEGGEEFSQTARLIEELPLAYLHVFPYSERPQTAALAIEPKVAEKIKKERAAILRELGAQKRETFSRSFVGKTLPVLVEQAKDKKTGLAKGFSHNYLPVLLEKHSASLVNTVVSATIENYREGKLTGRIIE